MRTDTHLRPYPQPAQSEAAGGDDMDQVPDAVWNAGGIIGLLSLLFVALVKGWLVVGSMHREQLHDKDAQIGRLWATVDSLTSSVQKLTVNSDITAHAFRSIEKRAAQNGGDAE